MTNLGRFTFTAYSLRKADMKAKVNVRHGPGDLPDETWRSAPRACVQDDTSKKIVREEKSLSF